MAGTSTAGNSLAMITSYWGGSSRLKGLLTRFSPLLSLASWLTRKSPKIFMFHRFCQEFGESPDRLDGGTFAWQLSILATGWTVMTLREYLALRQKGASIPPYIVVLTVDDGYADFYQVAYPILEKYGMKATVFPAIDFLEGKSYWWDRLHFMLANTQVEFARITLSGRSWEMNLTTIQGKRKAYDELNDLCVFLDEASRAAILQQLSEVLQVQPSISSMPGHAPLTWRQLQQLVAHGYEIGSHSISHPRLTAITRTSLRWELRTSKQILEERLGCPVVTLAYPNGFPSDVNLDVMQEAAAAGYFGAVLAYGIPSPSDNTFQLARMGASSDRSDFLWKLSGLENLGAPVSRAIRRLVFRCRAVWSSEHFGRTI